MNARIALIFSLLASIGLGQTDQPPSSVSLPTIRMNDREVHVHTQGLYVTDKHYLVTGRLETKPKRALLFRFSREKPEAYEYVDLTPANKGDATLDHPGGFDRDANGLFWIPVSTSNRKGPTVIYGLTIDDKKPLRNALEVQRKVEVEDHIGAICCVEKDLLAATWDTKTIYRIESNTGKILNAMERSKFIDGDPEWFLAVQDWKYDANAKLVVAGGIDKSAARPRDQSRAVLAKIDLRSRTVQDQRLDSVKGVARPLTNEGMAIFRGELFLLPEDLGRGAKILRFPYAKNPRTK